MADSIQDIEIVFEDDFIIAVNKPNNLIVHHSHYARNIRETSLAQLLREYCSAQTIHRLDRKTSGIILFAKTAECAKFLQEQFEEKKIQKSYLALVRGHTDVNGIIDSPIKAADKDEYKEAETHYRTLESITYKKAVVPYPTSRYSLIQLSPKTGRMHQLRKHMNKISHPIIGDPKYGNRHHNHAFEEWFRHSKLYLHASRITFEHPENGSLELNAKVPDFWLTDLEMLGFKTDLKKTDTA